MIDKARPRIYSGGSWGPLECTQHNAVKAVPDAVKAVPESVCPGNSSRGPSGETEEGTALWGYHGQGI